MDSRDLSDIQVINLRLDCLRDMNGRLAADIAVLQATITTLTEENKDLKEKNDKIIEDIRKWQSDAISIRESLTELHNMSKHYIDV